MASRPKRTVKEICRYAEEYEEYTRKKSYASSREATINSKGLYDVEIIERDHQRQMVKIHYVGHSCKYDRWIDRPQLPPALTRKRYRQKTQTKNETDADEETSGSEEKYGRKRKRKGKEKQATNPITM
eukprot:gene11411-12603_t